MRFLKDSGLTLALMAVFLICLGGMVLSGLHVENNELLTYDLPPTGIIEYFFSRIFQSALFDNWESEFLQMLTYVMMTVFLFQRGSSESKDPDAQISPEDKDSANKWNDPKAPWPVRAGGLLRSLYSYSLGIALAMLFVFSFFLHWLYSAGAANEEALRHGEGAQTFIKHLFGAQLWV